MKNKKNQKKKTLPAAKAKAAKKKAIPAKRPALKAAASKKYVTKHVTKHAKKQATKGAAAKGKTKNAAPAKAAKKTAPPKTAARKAAPVKAAPPAAVKKAALSQPVAKSAVKPTVKPAAKAPLVAAGKIPAKPAPAPKLSLVPELRPSPPAPRAPKPLPPPPPSHPVPAKEGEKFRLMLNTRKTSMVQSFNEFRERSQGLGEDGTQDIGDQATNSYNKELFLSHSEEHRTQIAAIEEALRRIDRGVYGICAACGDEIEPRRLNAVPWSTLCLRCQEAMDTERRA